jgi:hypothetical protein
VSVVWLNDTGVNQLVNRLHCTMQKVYTSLQRFVSASENLQVEVNNRLTLRVAQTSVYEQNITDKETEVLQTDETLASALIQLALAEQSVIEKQNTVASADQAVRDAEDAVEAARKF